MFFHETLRLPQLPAKSIDQGWYFLYLYHLPPGTKGCGKLAVGKTLAHFANQARYELNPGLETDVPDHSVQMILV